MGVLFNWEISYEKGACVLHMLRYTLGDALFFAVMQSYSNDTNLLFHSAAIADFKDKVNSVSGQDYNWFFNQWIYAPNHPLYSNQYYIESLGNGHWDLRFLIKQTQSDAPFFQMPVILKIHFQNNSDSLIRVINVFNHQEFNWTFSKQPASLAFYPDNEIVLKQATLAPGIFYTKTWTGATSDNWNVSTNWAPVGVPTNESVKIPAGAVRMPVVKDSGMSCGALLVEGEASLLINPGFTLSANGTVIKQ